MSETPIYDELAHTWRAAGRSVPGQSDLVWEALVHRPGRHRCPAPGGQPGP
ncbi:hypothetical protein [Kitasatospora sp. CMC57]|uniref:hypothetical protein n=1 Tax=Kitasatospora sp. CMC57 TaxID=3231513 RepID=UPI0038B4BCB8